MSLKDKAKKIDFGALPSASPEMVESSLPRPKTAPGMMMSRAADQRSDITRENTELKGKVAELETAAARAAELQDELAAWGDAKATRLLDPKTVTWSKWANRDEANFSTQEFAEFKDEIASAGGNVQPIKVRPIKPDGEVQYEIVFGHRRHRACLEQGLPVLALVDNIDEVELFVQMDRENRSRKDLSPWEQGKMYLQALDSGLFPSHRKLADFVGVHFTQIGKVLSIARLPKIVIDAFVSPLDLQVRWAKPLAELYETDRVTLTARASKAKELGPDRSPKAVLDLLMGTAASPSSGKRTEDITLKRDGKPAAVIRSDAKGNTMVSFTAEALPHSKLKDLSRLIEEFLSRK